MWLYANLQNILRGQCEAGEISVHNQLSIYWGIMNDNKHTLKTTEIQMLSAPKIIKQADMIKEGLL